MRYVFIGCTIVLLFSCKSSDSDNEKLKKRIDAMLVDITNEQLPASIRVDGILVEALRWGDTTGINILVTSERDYYDEKNSETSKELYAAQYVKKDTGYDLIWKSEEVERSCSFDITAEFIYKGTTVTDWDKDGIAEVTMLVRLACRSDVSPAVMKLIMHEGQDVYVLKGLSWIRSSPEDSFTVTEQ